MKNKKNGIATTEYFGYMYISNSTRKLGFGTRPVSGETESKKSNILSTFEAARAG
jgi:hypothetical protein